MKKKGMGIFLLAAVLTFAGCGSEAKSDGMGIVSGTNKGFATEEYVTNDMAEIDTENIYNEAPQEAGSSSAISESESVRAGRKLIRTATLTVETLEFDQLLNNLKSKADELGGYAENYDVNNGSNYHSDYYSGTSAYRKNRTAHIVFRIPKNKVDDFLGEVAEKSNIVNRSEQERDVTTEYVDLESHKATLKIEQERLLALLEQAYTLEDMLTLESRLSEIRYQLENIERNIRTYDSQIDYSTITLTVNEVVELTPVLEEEQSTWERISEGFLQSVQDIWEGLVEFFILFVVVLPYILLTVVILGLFILILVGVVKGCLKRQSKKLQKLENLEKAKEEEQK